MIYIKGNLLNSNAQTLVNTVNSVGVMGKGLAKEFKAKYPEMFQSYKGLCDSGTMKPGFLHLYKVNKTQWVLNFPTKIDWREPSRMKYIEAGLRSFLHGYATSGITSIAFPKLGCGNGGLNWERQVEPVMKLYLKDLPIPVEVYI